MNTYLGQYAGTLLPLEAYNGMVIARLHYDELVF